jgi:hypothetical protein
LLRVCESPLIAFEPVFMKPVTYITATELFSTVYVINPSHQCVCLYVCPTIVARQLLGENVTAATNTQVTIVEDYDASFSMRSVSRKRKNRRLVLLRTCCCCCCCCCGVKHDLGEILGREFSQCHLFTTNPAWPVPRFNPGANCLNYATA